METTAHTEVLMEDILDTEPAMAAAVTAVMEVLCIALPTVLVMGEVTAMEVVMDQVFMEVAMEAVMAVMVDMEDMDLDMELAMVTIENYLLLKGVSSNRL